MYLRAPLFLLFGVVFLMGLPQSGELVAGESDANQSSDTLSGVWQGDYFVNPTEVRSDGYLNITEHPDGSLTGWWGNSPRSVLKIESGERVTERIFQWEASSAANELGRYRVRAERKGETLELDVIYTWREAGQIKGLTASSLLTRKSTKDQF